MKEVIKCVFPVSSADYWRSLYFNEPFVRALHLEGLNCSDLEIIHWGGTVETGIARAFRSTPRIEAPPAVKKALGESVSYTEEGSFDPRTQRYSFEVIPSAMPNKIKIRGEYWLKERSESEVERVCELSFEVKLFGIGKLIEQFIARAFVDNQRRADEFTLHWVKKNF